MAKRAALYARISSEQQEEGTSLNGQISRMRRHALEKGYTIVAELREIHTGADPDRPELNRLREMARAGQVDVVVCYALDRFMRDETQAVLVEYELERAGVSVDFMDLPDSSVPGYKYFKALLRVQADEERRRITERTHRGRCDRARQGSTLVTGRPPYGYKSDRDEKTGLFRLIVDEEEAQIVRLIYEWYTRGDGENGPMSIHAIAHRLTGMGVPTRGDKNKRVHKKQGRGRWGKSIIGRILGSETYAGVWYYGKKGADGKRLIDNPPERWIAVDVPAIVDRETWEAAQRQREKNKAGGWRNVKHEYLLRRRVTCGQCGYKVQGTSRAKGSYLYYRCPGQRSSDPGRARSCNLPLIRAEMVDAAVWEWVRDLLMDPECLTAHLRQKQAQREEEAGPLRARLAIVEEQLADRRRKRDKLLDDYLAELFDKDELQGRKVALEREIAQYEEARAGLQVHIERSILTERQIQTIGDLARGIRQALEQADETFATKRKLVEFLNVQAILSIEDGEYIVRVRCIIDEEGSTLSPLAQVERGCKHQALPAGRGL